MARRLGAVEQFIHSHRTQPFIAPQRMVEFHESLQGPRPAQIGTRRCMCQGELREVRVFASNYVPPQDDFYRRVVALGMGRKQRSAS